MNAYRLILYQKAGDTWQYVRLKASPDGSFRTETGNCGSLPTFSEERRMPLDADPKTFLRKEASLWQEEGYHKPNQKMLQVMTLHFRFPRWSGPLANAPWFEEWTANYLEPIQKAFDSAAIGVFKSNERFSGNHLYYYMVYNADAARQTVEQIVAAAGRRFPLDLHIGDREKQVSIPIDPGVPEYLRAIFRGFEKSARLLRDMPHLAATDPLQPELLVEPAPRAVRGEEAARLRLALKTRWRFDCKLPDPFADQLPGARLICLDELPDAVKSAVPAKIREKTSGPYYSFDCDAGIFEIIPEQIFNGAFEGAMFDADMDWIIYCSQHFTTTFGGQWLVDFVHSVCKNRPENFKFSPV
jgi:hypothetical protein